jgi:multidrug efflux pump subunit AcrA (membrane-fusion protein)
VVALVAVGALVAFRSGLVGAKPAVVMLALVEGAGSTGAGGSAGGVEVLTANGYVVPRKKASVSSEVGGRLAALYVTEGDTATAGQVLGVLRNDDFRSAIAGNEARLAQTRAALTEARAALSLAQTDHKRAKEMFDRQLTAQSAYDAAKSTARQHARVEVATYNRLGRRRPEGAASCWKTFIRARSTARSCASEVRRDRQPAAFQRRQTRNHHGRLKCEMEWTSTKPTSAASRPASRPKGRRLPACFARSQVVPTADRQGPPCR